MFLIHILEKAGINTKKCMMCGKEIKYPYKHIHHKNKDVTDNRVENLMVVCVKCHKRLDGWGFYTDYAKKHNISQAYAWGLFHPEKKKAYSNPISRKVEIDTRIENNSNFQINKRNSLQLKEEIEELEINISFMKRTFRAALVLPLLGE